LLKAIDVSVIICHIAVVVERLSQKKVDSALIAVQLYSHKLCHLPFLHDQLKRKKGLISREKGSSS
jgi:hypothetical protein